jgi:Tol biopolymer transport system component
MRTCSLNVRRMVVLISVFTQAGVRAVTAQVAGRDTTVPQAAGVPDRSLREQFLVMDHGYALLGPNGEEQERLDSITNAAGAFSPDGRWILFSKLEPTAAAGELQSNLIIQSRLRKDERRTVPMVWGNTGSSFLPLWSGDSGRILICEQGQKRDGTRGSSYRVYELGTNRLTELKRPADWWPSDWSGDGKRLLTDIRADGVALRVAWVNSDGSGKPEFITSEHEVAYGARLSPDGGRILCMIGPKAAPGETRPQRLNVIDLSSGKRIPVDRPGHTYGYCWSSDGRRIAYTWQLPLRQPGETAERRTYLLTCDADGSNRKTVTMRKVEIPPNNSGKDAVVRFFQVLAWWR